MKRFFSDIVDLRPGEGGLTLLMAGYYFLLLVTFYLLKPARDSLFLTKLSPAELPFVFILTAVAALPFTAVYTRASRALHLNQLVSVSTVVMIVCLLTLRWLITIDAGWIYYAFYVWVGVYGILATAQFWLLANAVYDAAQAKRVFSLLGAAGIVGAFVGGEFTGFVVDQFSLRTENLLYLCAIFLLTCVVLVNLIWRKSRSGELEAAETKRKHERHESTGDLVREIKKSRHLLLIVGIIATAVMISTFVDYQFKEISYEAYSSSEQGLTAFFGKFYGRVSLISLVLQVFLTYKLLRKIGVAGAILIMPSALLLGSTTMLIAPVLLSAILLKGSESSFEYSIDKVGRELLFLPLPLTVKKRTKLFIDIFVDRWFRGIAGALLLLFTSVFAFSAQHLSIVVLGLALVWISLAVMVRKEYVNAFRRALEMREIDAAEIRVNINDTATVNSLIGLLASPNDRQVSYALDMLKSVKDERVVEPIAPLLDHPSAEVRRKSLELLQAHHEIIE